MTAAMPMTTEMTQMTGVKLVDRAVMSPCSLPVAASWGTGLSASALLLPVIPVRVRDERPTEASEAAVVKAQAPAYAFTAAAEGAGAGGASGAKGANGNGHANGQQKKTQHGMRAFRGLEPWSDPA
jgi:hypothetical protein